MWRKEIEKFRATSRSKDDGPWVQWWDQQAIKTVLKRISKQVPLSERTRDVIDADNAEYELDTGVVPTQAASPAQRGKSRTLAALKAPEPNPLDALEREQQLREDAALAEQDGSGA
jgi:recombination protein RecT